jgi:hypothetical protein
MSTIAYRDYHLPYHSVFAAKRAAVRPREDILRRIFAAIDRLHQRHIEQEAGQFIATHGGRLTDDIERQLGERFSGRGFVPPR